MEDRELLPHILSVGMVKTQTLLPDAPGTPAITPKVTTALAALMIGLHLAQALALALHLRLTAHPSH